MLHDLANDGDFLLHSNWQLRTERDGDTEKGCHKPALQQKTTDDDGPSIRRLLQMADGKTLLLQIFFLNLILP